MTVLSEKKATKNPHAEVYKLKVAVATAKLKQGQGIPKSQKPNKDM